MSLAPPPLVSSRIVAATSHPTRLRALTVLVEEEATPAQIASLIDEPVNNVSYHIKVLVDLDCVELLRVEQAGGGRVAQHIYRATKRTLLDVEAWNELSEVEKLQFNTALMRMISDDIATAMSHGTFSADDDNHISRMPMTLDDGGWQEVVSLLESTLAELMAIQNRVDVRTTDNSERSHHTKVNIIHFRSPPPRKAAS